MAKNLYPFINRHTGEVQILTKSAGKKLNEDWSHAKPAINEKGENVFRFEIATSMVDKNGKTQHGTAVVDILEVEVNGNGSTK